MAATDQDESVGETSVSSSKAGVCLLGDQHDTNVSAWRFGLAENIEMTPYTPKRIDTGIIFSDKHGVWREGFATDLPPLLMVG